MKSSQLPPSQKSLSFAPSNDIDIEIISSTMSTIKELSEEEKGLITPFLPTGDAPAWRPFVTLTYAQSLDR